MSAARRYSDAQLVRFDRMGLVPWVRRDDRAGQGGGERSSASAAVPCAAPIAAPATASGAASSATSGAASAEARSSAPAVRAGGLPEPAELSAFGDWLAQQPLAAFARRGEQRHETGPEQAGMLVVAQASSGEVSLLPLAAEEAELLDLMLRAIGSAPGDWSTAVLADPVRDAAQDGAGGLPCVADLLEGRRVVLWLTRSPGDEPNGDAHRFRVAGVPAFRIAHPARLLSQPQAKRQAWTVLKAVRNQLATS